MGKLGVHSKCAGSVTMKRLTPEKGEAVLLFPNGRTAFYRNGERIRELEPAWLDVFCKFLAEKGVDVESLKIVLPDFVIMKAKEVNLGRTKFKFKLEE